MRGQKGLYGSILMIGCGLLLLAGAGRQQTEINGKLQQAVLRFHVLADSDEPAAQEVKLLVRDVLLAEIQPLLAEAHDFTESRWILTEHTKELADAAAEILRQQGSSLPVRVELTRDWFPVKQYGNLVLPAGEYEALRVSIGRAAGENWWCMLFPELCFLEESYEMREEDTGVLRQILTQEEFRQIWQDDETRVKIRFWVWEQVEHFLQKREHK